MTSPHDEKWSSPERVANHLGVNKDTIRNRIKKLTSLHTKSVDNMLMNDFKNRR